MQRKIQIVVRVLLGGLFLFGGIAFFFTTPPALTGDMATFFNGLMASKYFFFLLKGTEIFCGACLVSGFFVPLALVILAPIALNILLVHLFLEPSGLWMASLICAAVIYLSFFSGYSAPIKRLFVMKS
jgi:putative oxidoreductase